MNVPSSLFNHAVDVMAGPALKLVGVPGEYVPAIIKGLKDAEALGVAGPDKKAHVEALVKDVISALAIAFPALGLTSPLITTLVSEGIDCAITAVNAYVAAHPAAAKGA